MADIDFSNVKSLTIPVGDTTKEVRKIMFNNVVHWEYTYVWAKYVFEYVSYTYGTSSRSYNTTTSSNSLVLWPVSSRVADSSAIVDTGGTELDISGVSQPVYNLVYGTGFSYNYRTGTFSLSGQTTQKLGVVSSFSNYDIENSFVGKYVIYDGDVYKITGHNDIYSLTLGERYYPHSIQYGYAYGYSEDVSSKNSTTYTSSNTPNTNSIAYYDDYKGEYIEDKTIYVKKGW